MIRISVDTDIDLECIRYIKDNILCYFVKDCSGKYNDCNECAKDNIDKLVQLTKREIVETPITLVV